MEKAYVVGVDIGGQTTKIGIVDRRGTIIAQTVIGSKYKAGEAGVFIQSVYLNMLTSLSKPSLFMLFLRHHSFSHEKLSLVPHYMSCSGHPSCLSMASILCILHLSLIR